MYITCSIVLAFSCTADKEGTIRQKAESINLYIYIHIYIYTERERKREREREREGLGCAKSKQMTEEQDERRVGRRAGAGKRKW